MRVVKGHPIDKKPAYWLSLSCLSICTSLEVIDVVPPEAISAAARAALSTLAGALIALLLAAAAATPVLAHGYTTHPTGRQLFCAQRVVTDCGPIQYQPHGVEGPKGFPYTGPADGLICAGGNVEFAPLDNPRGGNWPKTRLAAGERFEFGWTFTAARSTSSVEYFITEDGWNPHAPIGRVDLDPAPFLTVPLGGQPAREYDHSGTLPAGKSGHHVILTVWTVADTDNAFYACADVDFADDGDELEGPDKPEPGECTAPAWNFAAAYNAGEFVSHDGTQYRAKWWTRAEEPGTTGEWGAWESLGNC